MIEEDLSKQLGSSPRDMEWDAEPSLEPFVTGFENGGKQRIMGQLLICQYRIYDDQEACKILYMCIKNKTKKACIVWWRCECDTTCSF